MTDLGERLRELRRPLSQRDAAEMLGVSPALVSAWEGGHAVPPLRRLEGYALAFGIDYEGILIELTELRANQLPAALVLIHHDESITRILVREIGWLLVEIRGRLITSVLHDVRSVLVGVRDRLPPPGQYD